MGAGRTDYSTRQAVIFVLAEDTGQLLGLVELVESGTGFGRWIRHVAVVEKGKCNGLSGSLKPWFNYFLVALLVLYSQVEKKHRGPGAT